VRPSGSSTSIIPREPRSLTLVELLALNEPGSSLNRIVRIIRVIWVIYVSRISRISRVVKATS
jgi:hypothetical protein